ncbi:MAG: TIGR02996 domain-containing protein [Myxococcaceae bacterium]|nr:TIGR02996 domain-containing protein [Myxococcaceae bacterium]
MPPPPELARVLASPDDLQLRQVFADKLQEKGDPRGTFISMQLELLRLDPADPRYPGISAESRRLEHRHRRVWLADVFDRIGDCAPVFRAGFLSTLTIDPLDLDQHWPWLRAREPVEGVTVELHEALPEEARVRKLGPELKRLRVVPEQWVTAFSVSEILAWDVSRLVSLDLSGCDLGTDGAKLLAGLETTLGEHFERFVAPPPFVPGVLRQLQLRGCQLGDEGAATLLGAERLGGLTDLDLSQNRLSDTATLKALAAAPLPSLERVSIAGNVFRDGLAALGGWSQLSKLRALGLPQSTTKDDVLALFKRPSAALRELDLRSGKELLETPLVVFDCATQLTHLDLGTTSLGDDGLQALLDHPASATLRTLKLNGCSLSDASVELLTRQPRGLVELDLSSNKLTDKALAALAAWDGLSTVVALRLGNNRKLTAKGYDALVRAQHFEPARLDVGKVGDKGLLKQLTARFNDALVSG